MNTLYRAPYKALTGLILALSITATAAHAAEGPVNFAAVMSADEESTTTDSPGTGKATFSLDRDTLKLSWTVTFEKLTGPAIGAHVHGPQRPGTNAGIQIDMGTAGLKSPLTGSAVLNDGQLEYLLSGRMYVNVHTAKYPAGEIRGQIQRVRPAAP